MDLWEDFTLALDRESPDRGRAPRDHPRARDCLRGRRSPDLAVASLRAARREPRLKDVPALVQLPTRQVAAARAVERLRRLHRPPVRPRRALRPHPRARVERSEFSTEERLKMGPVVIDRAANEVTLDGRRVTLTAKEFALLAYLAANRGRLFSRQVLLARVWGPATKGGRARWTSTCAACARSWEKVCRSRRCAGRDTSCARRSRCPRTRFRLPWTTPRDHAAELWGHLPARDGGDSM